MVVLSVRKQLAQRRCKNCIHWILGFRGSDGQWKNYVNQPKGGEKGKCRVDSPVIFKEGSHAYGRWPTTYAGDHCGWWSESLTPTPTSTPPLPPRVRRRALSLGEEPDGGP